MKALTSILIVFLFSQLAFGQTDSTGTIQGKIIDKKTKRPLMFGNVAIYKSGSKTPLTGTETDLDGNYLISNLDTGSYDILVSYADYSTLKVIDVEISQNEIIKKDFELKANGSGENYGQPPLIQLNHFSSGRVFKTEDIKQSPIKN